MADIVTPISTASKIIADLKIKNPREIRIELIAQSFGATVSCAPLRAAAGRLVRYGDFGIITVPNDFRNEGRKRFSIGHELGHFILHKGIVDFSLCSVTDMNDWKGIKIRETEANQFSGELLMPQDLFLQKTIKQKPNMKLIKQLASEFRTSLTATAIRFIHVTKEPCALIYCVNGKIEWTMKNDADFKYVIKKHGQEVDEESYAYEAFKGQGDFEEGNLIPASAWVQSKYLFETDLEFIESTCFLSSFNAVLSLLWEK